MATVDRQLKVVITGPFMFKNKANFVLPTKSHSILLFIKQRSETEVEQEEEQTEKRQ